MDISIRGGILITLLAVSPVIAAMLSYDNEPSALPTKVVPVLSVPELRLPKTVNKEQAELLLYAFNTAKKHGHRDPAVLQGIIWQESRAGNYPGFEVAGHNFGLTFGKRYYGVSQIKLAAAQDVFKRFPEEFADISTKTEEEIIANLILDNEFNVTVASRYLWMVGHTAPDGRKRSTNFAITAYNQGVSGARKLDADSWHYTVAVNKYKGSLLREFNMMNQSQLD
jgi:soluble lytic murein transglycosylase-like protein